MMITALTACRIMKLNVCYLYENIHMDVENIIPYKKKKSLVICEISLINLFRLYLQFLPIYTPSEEEKRNPALFAINVRRVMAK